MNEILDKLQTSQFNVLYIDFQKPSDKVEHQILSTNNWMRGDSDHIYGANMYCLIDQASYKNFLFVILEDQD